MTSVLASVTLKELHVHPAAYFYRTSVPLDAAALARLLYKLNSDGNARRLQETFAANAGTPEVHVAAVIRKHTPKPAFLPHSDIRELRYSLTLLVAVGDVLAVHSTAGGRWTGSILAGKAERFDAEVVSNAISDGGVFKKVKMRSMSLSTSAIRSKTIESPELESSLPPQGLNRQISEAATVSKSGRSMTATPTTARITESSERLTVNAFVSWVIREGSLLEQQATTPIESLFLSRFAAPVSMAQLTTKGIRPTGVLINLEWLSDGLEHGTLAVERQHKKKWNTVDGPALIEMFSSTGAVGTRNGSTHAVDFADPTHKCKLHSGKRTFRISGNVLNTTHVRDVATGARQTLAQRINDEDALFVTLSDIQYAYVFGRLFRDRAMATQVQTIRNLLRPVAQLANCTSEKGAQTSATSAFSSKSIFKIVESVISAPAEEKVLLLDDLNDEWADFIGIDARSSSARISLYHAKHKPSTGTGASPLHEVVAQALKNLGRVSVRLEELKAKKSSTWAKKWGKTKIKRLRRGSSVAKAVLMYADASLHTSLRARVCIVASFISKKQIERVLAKLSSSTAVLPHEMQLLHLLIAFMSQVRESNAEPVMYCAP